MSHTPGPWLVGEGRDEEGEPCLSITRNGRREIAVVHIPSRRTRHTAKQDADLIAAAPDLVEAVQKLIAQIEYFRSGGDQGALLADVCAVEWGRHALRKAGVQP